MSIEYKEFEYEIICHEEETEIEGNASCIDPETDNAANHWIRYQLEHGNPWAWCTVEVKCTYKSLEFSDYLGCCSYKSEEDFTAPGGYYNDMVEEVNRRMVNAITEIKGAQI